jgi:hypothetical protein
MRRIKKAFQVLLSILNPGGLKRAMLGPGMIFNESDSTGGFMMKNILLATFCSFLISCATMSSNESASDQGQIPAPDGGVAADTSAVVPPTGEVGPPAADKSATAGMDFPSEAMPNQVTSGVEQVAISPPPPELKPVRPASSWTAQSSSIEQAPVMPQPDRWEKKAKPSKASLKAAKASKNKKSLAQAKKSKKNKVIAKKLTKAQCKKLAKNSKKHKKEIAMCKLEQKKAAAKLKKSGKVARR